MSDKKITVTLRDGKYFETTKTKVTITDWGIRFVTASEKSIMYIPWTNLSQIEELIYQPSFSLALSVFSSSQNMPYS